MPIVVALGNKYLEKTVHWPMIKTILNTEVSLEDLTFNLGELIELKVADFQEDIINISVTATQEFLLKEQLDKINLLWKELEFK
jgi:hypothetical protein